VEGDVTHSAAEIQDWIVTRVSSVTGIAPADIDAEAPFRRYGLDSVAVVTLAADLETWLGYRFRSNPLDEHPTIAALARFLADELAADKNS
jgi:myxalamid-type polyketide synthase MxaE and MxaD